jgi:hypothetical protein
MLAILVCPLMHQIPFYGDASWQALADYHFSQFALHTYSLTIHALTFEFTREEPRSGDESGGTIGYVPLIAFIALL